MHQGILTINAGSSSIKFALFVLDESLAQQALLTGQIDGIGGKPRLSAKNRDGERIAAESLSEGLGHAGAFDALLACLQANDHGVTLAAVGHRVVHGGREFSRPVVIDEVNLAAMIALTPLAPLHQPHNIAGIKALAARCPGVPQVACFDTAFHSTQPKVAQTFAIPRSITAEGVRRYGFHGLSYEYIADVLAQHTDLADARVVVAHLGNGASMTAMIDRQSRAHTLGFTAVDGLMMGTRCGSLDPGVLLYLMETKGWGAAEIGRMMYNESGLLGVSGISNDMRELLASPSPEAAEAIDLFCYRINRELGSLAASIGGLDALVFTGGIGEHATEIRHRICDGTAWLGIDFDPVANRAGNKCISRRGSPVEVLVIPTNEEWIIARHTQRLLQQAG